MAAVSTAYCPGCKAKLPQDYLKYPVMGCPRCERVIHYSDFRTPVPPVFDQIDLAARRTTTRLHRAWERGSAKERVEILNKLNKLLQTLETA